MHRYAWPARLAYVEDKNSVRINIAEFSFWGNVVLTVSTVLYLPRGNLLLYQWTFNFLRTYMI